MATLADDGTLVPNSVIDKEGRHVIRQFGTEGLLDDGSFVFGLASTSGGGLAKGRRLISPLGFHTAGTVIRY